MLEESDEALLRRWAGGDRGAGDALLTRHFDWLYGFFFSKLNAAADDLVQQTMLACIEQIDRLAEVSSFRAYVFGIARYKLYGELRRRGDGRFDATQVSLEQALGGATGGYSQRLVERSLQLAMGRLPVEIQLALEMHYWHELSSREISDALGIPAATIRSRIGRGRELLRKELEAGSTSKEAVEAALNLLDGDDGGDVDR